MEWQAVVFALQILLLALSWVLFQKARAELSAKAVETPVLNEVRALQKNVKQMLGEMESASNRSSAQLESRCERAQELLAALERQTESARNARNTAPPAAPIRPKRTPRFRLTSPGNGMNAPALESQAVVLHREGAGVENLAARVTATTARRREVYALTDAGEPIAAIARQTGISEGEIETLIGLRKNRV